LIRKSCCQSSSTPTDIEFLIELGGRLLGDHAVSLQPVDKVVQLRTAVLIVKHEHLEVQVRLRHWSIKLVKRLRDDFGDSVPVIAIQQVRLGVTTRRRLSSELDWESSDRDLL
jgi:hypothetical protein